MLECTVVANPPDVDFTWKIKNENETIEENIVKDGLRSFLTLETRVENFRTYLCFANNSVGMSIACERDVTGESQLKLNIIRCYLIYTIFFTFPIDTN